MGTTALNNMQKRLSVQWNESRSLIDIVNQRLIVKTSSCDMDLCKEIIRAVFIQGTC